MKTLYLIDATPPPSRVGVLSTCLRYYSADKPIDDILNDAFHHLAKMSEDIRELCWYDKMFGFGYSDADILCSERENIKECMVQMANVIDVVTVPCANNRFSLQYKGRLGTPAKIYLEHKWDG